MKRLLSVFLCVCLILTLAPTTVAFGAVQTQANYRNMAVAESQYYVATGKVAAGAGGLNVRKAPDSSAAVCNVLNDGKVLYILKKETVPGWHEIYYNGYLGYVMSEYVAEVTDIESNQDRINLGYGVDVGFAGGRGTKEDPYIIKTPAQLNSVRFHMNDDFKLANDINLSKWGQWLPIGDNIWYNGRPRGIASGRDAAIFIGHFNGNGHVIKGMNIIINRKTPAQPEPERMDERHFGLFGIVSNRSTKEVSIKNLGLVNYKIDVRYTGINCQLFAWTGAFSSSASNCKISKCWTKNGSVKMTVNRGEQKKVADKNVAQIKMGGITGDSTEVRFADCANTGDVILKTDDLQDKIKSKNVGGITSGGNFTFVDRCFNSGNISMPKSNCNGHSIGGIMAWLPNPISGGNGDKGHIFDSYNTGKISGGYFAGGLFGYSSIGMRLDRCYSIGKVVNAPYKGSLYSKSASIAYARNCYTKGSSVSGDAWRNSSSLKRKILKNMPETNIPSSKKA